MSHYAEKTLLQSHNSRAIPEVYFILTNNNSTFTNKIQTTLDNIYVNKLLLTLNKIKLCQT